MTTEPARAAKQDIAEVLVRYATGIDRRQWDVFHSCFAADCHIDYGSIGVWESPEAITEYMIGAHAQLGHTMHRISNMAIDVDGDTAVAHSYVDAVLMTPSGESGLHPTGFYHDHLARTEHGWRIARRTFTMVHLGAIGG